MDKARIFHGTRKCEKCGMLMIKKHPFIRTFPYTPYSWWCKCGHTENGGQELQETVEERLERKWKEANG